MNADRARRRAMAWKKIRGLTKGCTLETWESWEDGCSDDGKPLYTCKVRDLLGHLRDRQFFQAACSISRTWRVNILVKCQTEDGAEYIEETELEADNVKLDDFFELYKAERQATIDACNPKHIKDVGWKAKALN